MEVLDGGRYFRGGLARNRTWMWGGKKLFAEKPSLLGGRDSLILKVMIYGVYILELVFINLLK